MPPFLPGSADVGDRVAQPIERELEGRLGHGEFVLARAGQKVGDVGVEPQVVAADAPQAERTSRVLPREQRLDGVANPLIRGGVEREMRLARRVR